jgi:uncharacterized protein
VSEILSSGPNYTELVRFLLQPFLDAPQSLKVDCEIIPSTSRVWIRLAFESADRGRVYGRGGRNIQAIRTVLEATAQAVGQTICLDIYGSSNTNSHQERTHSSAVAGKPTTKNEPPKPRPEKPVSKNRTQ